MTCRTCAIEFTPPDKRGLSRYCSTQCRAKADAKRTLEGYHRRVSKLRYTCKHCKAIYVPKSANRNQFCSVRCRNASRGDLSKPSSYRPSCTVHFPICGCGKQFVARTALQKACSLECSSKLRVVDHCEHCGVEYVPAKGQRMCSVTCRQASRKESRQCARRLRKQKGLNHRKHRDRARYYGVAYETIYLSKVLERDGPTCMLCGVTVNLYARVPHPRSATIDHVIPMSKREHRDLEGHRQPQAASRTEKAEGA